MKIRISIDSFGLVEKIISIDSSHTTYRITCVMSWMNIKLWAQLNIENAATHRICLLCMPNTKYSHSRKPSRSYRAWMEFASCNIMSIGCVYFIHFDHNLVMTQMNALLQGLNKTYFLHGHFDDFWEKWAILVELQLFKKSTRFL